MTDEEIKEYWRAAYCNEKHKKEELEAQLNKAKELIKDLLSELDDMSELSGMSYKAKLKEQAEQFLK